VERELLREDNTTDTTSTTLDLTHSPSVRPYTRASPFESSHCFLRVHSTGTDPHTHHPLHCTTVICRPSTIEYQNEQRGKTTNHNTRGRMGQSNQEKRESCDPAHPIVWHHWQCCAAVQFNSVPFGSMMSESMQSRYSRKIRSFGSKSNRLQHPLSLNTAMQCNVCECLKGIDIVWLETDAAMERWIF
jgi:hypothetical protein